MLNANIQWAFPLEKQRRNHLKFDFYPGLGIWRYAELGLLKINHFEMTPEEVWRDGSLREKILGILAQGACALVYVDYFYIDGTAEHRQKHFGHPWLIFDHNPETSQYVGALYTKEGRFGVGTLSVDRLPEAFRPSPGRKRRRTRRSSCSMIEMQKAKVKGASTLEKTDIKAQLASYLNSSNLARDKLNNSTMNCFLEKFIARPPKAAFGINAYDAIAAYFGQQFKGRHSQHDLRVTRFVWEHKKLMKIRLTRMIHEGMVLHPTTLPEWNSIEQLAYWIHLKAFAAKRQGDLPALAALSQEFSKLKSLEACFIDSLLKQF